MRSTFILILGCFGSLLLSTSAYAQEWKDTLNHARKLYTEGKYKEALKYYKTTEQLAPNDVNLSEEIGQSAYKAGDYKTAEEQYEASLQAAKTSKDKVRLNTNLAETRMKQKNFEGAIEAYKEALRIDPTSEKARQGLMEAKRQKEKSCQNPNNQNQNQNQQQNQQQNQNSNNNNSNNQNNQNQQSQQNKENKSNKGNEQAQGNKPKQQNQSGQKLANKQADRKLDDLSRQEMNTKKRLGGTKGINSGKSARKDW